MAKTDPIRPTDADAVDLARGVLRDARIAALGTVDPDTSGPMVTRIAVSVDADGAPVSLISHLSHHTKALVADPRASLLLGEPGAKGDPLNHPRLTLLGHAIFVERAGSDHHALRERWLDHHPKSKLYIDFGDFCFVRFSITKGYLNGGFGAAFVLTPQEIGTAKG